MPLWQVILGCVPKSPETQGHAPLPLGTLGGKVCKALPQLNCLQWPHLGLQDQVETPLEALRVLQDVVLGHFALLPTPSPTARVGMPSTDNS